MYFSITIDGQHYEESVDIESPFPMTALELEAEYRKWAKKIADRKYGASGAEGELVLRDIELRLTSD